MTDTLFDLLKVGERAAARHKRRVIDAIKKHASDLLVSEDMVTASGGKRMRVRIRLLETPTFRFNYHDETMVGVSDQDLNPGDVLIDESPEEGEGEGAGDGEGSGSSYEVEMSAEEIIDLLMEEWELPNLEAKKRNEITSEDYTLTDISRKGPRSRVHKKLTLRNAIKRAVSQEADEIIIHNDDLRFRSPKTVKTYSSNAVIFLVRDRSGSMGEFEMKVSRMMSIWLVQFLRRRYDKVAIRFILHDHNADEVDEHTFYHVTAGGGTQMTEAYAFVQNAMKEYPPSEWNRYVAQFSDGDDYDPQGSVNMVKEMLPLLEAFAYYEINERDGAKYSAFWNLQTDAMEDEDNFIRFGIADEDDVPMALRAFLARNE